MGAVSRTGRRAARCENAAVSPPQLPVRQRLKAAMWRRLYGRWPDVPPLEPGYTLLLPVPADLPAFLHLALANAAAQDPAHRVQTLVVPDAPSRAFSARFDAARARYDAGDVRLVAPGARGRLAHVAARNGSGTNHFVQLHAGIAASRTTHVLIHDADLFLDDLEFMATLHRRCLERGLACQGISPAPSRKPGYEHAVATWELMIETGWARSFPPWQHRPHEDVFAGERYIFDTMLMPQAQTAPERCMVDPGFTGFEHFNWVIGVYRDLFQPAT